MEGRLSSPSKPVSILTPMDEQDTQNSAYEDWDTVMEALLHGDPDHKQLAFLKLNRLISGFLTASQAWDYRDNWEDLRQTVLMKLVKSFNQGQLRESRAFVAYARTITRNEFYDFLKTRGSPLVEGTLEQGEEEAKDEETI